LNLEPWLWLNYSRSRNYCEFCSVFAAIFWFFV